MFSAAYANMCRCLFTVIFYSGTPPYGHLRYYAPLFFTTYHFCPRKTPIKAINFTMKIPPVWFHCNHVSEPVLKEEFNATADFICRCFFLLVSYQRLENVLYNNYSESRNLIGQWPFGICTWDVARKL